MWIRYLLGALLAFGAINAFAGGYYGLSGAPGVPLEWLAGSPFKDYFIPSLILLVVVGGAFSFAAVAVFARSRLARVSAFAAGIVVLVWITVQLAIIGYPYTDISAYIPRGFLWMYQALVPAPLFVILLSGIQERAMAGRKRFGGLAVAFGVMAATLLTADYFIQLRVIQPAVLKGELEGLAPLTQYNPHGVFIALEEAGYLFMAVAFLFAALALSARNRLYRATRWVFAGGFTAAMLLFLVLSFAYGLDVEYRFEVAAITVDWTVLIVVGTLLAFAYRRGASEP